MKIKFQSQKVKSRQTTTKKEMAHSSVFQREKEYFQQSPLDLTDHFCNSVNRSLVDAVDTFQVWVARNLVTFSLTQCKRVLTTASIGTAVSTKDITHALREVIADSGPSPAAAAVVVAAQLHASKSRRRVSKSHTTAEDNLIMVTAGQLLDAAANLSLDNTVSDISDIGVMLNVDVFREVQLGCDSLMSSLRQAADKTCDKFELYLLNNVLSIPDDLYVPGLDDEIFNMGGSGASSSSLAAAATGAEEARAEGTEGTEAKAGAEVVQHTAEEERAVDVERASLRDQIIKLRRSNARLARTQGDLHVQLERWQNNMMPLVEAVAEKVAGVSGSENGEKDSSGANLADAVQVVLRDAEQLSQASADLQGEKEMFLLFFFYFFFFFFAPHRKCFFFLLFSLLFSLSHKLKCCSVCAGAQNKRCQGNTLWKWQAKT